MRKRFGVTPAGINMHHLKGIASEYNLDCKGYKLKTEQLNQLQPPFILFWDNCHFVVLEQWTKRKMTILDPAIGRYELNIKEFDEKFSNFVLTFTPKELFKHKKRKADYFFISSVLNEWKLIFSIIFIALLLQAAGILMPRLTQWCIDVIIGEQRKHLLLPFVMIIGALFLYTLGFYSLRGWLIAKLQSRIDTTMMSRYMGRLFTLSYNFFENRKGGELVFVRILIF